MRGQIDRSIGGEAQLGMEDRGIGQNRKKESR